MKDSNVNLHMERRRTLEIMLFFALVFVVIGCLVSAIIGNKCVHLNSLLNSNYLYSVTSGKVASEDTYYQFNAGIDFAKNADSNTRINAEVIMQAEEVEYTSVVNWNAEELSNDGIAITESLAHSNGLAVGSKVYSKHVVDGTLHEYTVEQILPELSSVRSAKNGGFSDGVIVMGYDAQYTANLSYACVIFTNDSIEDLTVILSLTPENILYRTDEIGNVLQTIIPYLIVAMILSAVAAIVLCHLLTQSIKYNFRRLVVLGFSNKKLNAAYNKLVYGVGLITILAAFVIAAIVSKMIIFSLVEILLLLIVSLTGFIALCISAESEKSRLWRC